MCKRWGVVLRVVAMAGSLSSLACLGFVAGCDVVPDGGNGVPDACAGNPCEDENPCTIDTCSVDALAEGGYTCTYADVECDEGFVCDEATGECVEAAEPGPAETFPGSLHDGNFRGMEYFYSADQDGFEVVTNVPYDDLGCKNCHDASRFENADPPVEWPGTDSCSNCHEDLADPPAGITDDLCLGCHGRQKTEAGFFTDVHRDAGFTCMRCHLLSEMHGDGTEYNSIHESPSPACEDCHVEGGEATAPPANSYHSTHLETVDCSACHVQSVISCYNCHFESELAGAGKRAVGKLQGFKMLVNFGDKVQTATFQSLVYSQEPFYAIAPYYAHSVTNGENVTCGDCHLPGNTAVQEYDGEGTITVATFADGALQGPVGVIPIPEDYADALYFDFVDYTGDATTPIADTDPTLWELLDTGPPETQMLFCTPLTDEQMGKLSLPVGG